ncbi:MAG TPA: hypothetical protein DCP28_19795, partial [Cytophagales bacterium]|nr:hypothetical protein [Cytophagales bacterium]
QGEGVEILSARKSPLAGQLGASDEEKPFPASGHLSLSRERIFTSKVNLVSRNFVFIMRHP